MKVKKDHQNFNKKFPKKINKSDNYKKRLKTFKKVKRNCKNNMKKNLKIYRKRKIIINSKKLLRILYKEIAQVEKK